MSDIALLILRQNTATLDLWCRQCDLTFKKTLPATMGHEQVTCPGCDTKGLVVPDTKA